MRIDYTEFLRARKKPITTMEALEEWYTKFTAAKRARLVKMCIDQNHLCYYCQRKCRPVGGIGPDPVPTTEHLIRRVDGGNDSTKNNVMACSRCNGRRGDIPHEQFKMLGESGWMDFVYSYSRENKDKSRTASDKKRQNKQILWVAYYMLWIEREMNY